MAKSHNKKRNVGVIYEVLIKYIAECMVEKNDSERKIASRIVRKYFSKGTEIFKEYRLFKSLTETTVSAPSVASSILYEAKRASRTFNQDKLKKEKSNLIREVNYQLDSKALYSIRVQNYRLYATIQTALNEWRKDIPDDLRKLADYEDKLTTWLVAEKSSADPCFDEKKDVDNFVIRLMAEKFNDRYSSTLNDDQKRLLKKYVFSNDKNTVRAELTALSEKALTTLDNYESNSEYVMSKVKDVRGKIQNQDFDKVNDELVEKSLILLNLINQMESENV
jgi:hypothetical protein